MIIPAQLRAHLEGPDHNAVIGPRLKAWVSTHTALHMTVNRGWRAQGLIGSNHPIFHELHQPADHELQEVK